MIIDILPATIVTVMPAFWVDHPIIKNIIISIKPIIIDMYNQSDEVIVEIENESNDINKPANVATK